MGAEERHVSESHLLTPQDPVLNLFFFFFFPLGRYRNIYTLVPSPSEGVLTPVDFEKRQKHTPRQRMSAIAEGKSTHRKKGVNPHVVNLQIQEEPVLYNLLFAKYRHSSLFLRLQSSSLHSCSTSCSQVPG